ncbi:hypothetical protein BCN_2242 [Bacillus cereus NC7401]|nr:hypothetical protein BCN_2242 [Bacillus cereus NC7401]
METTGPFFVLVKAILIYSFNTFINSPNIFSTISALNSRT